MYVIVRRGYDSMENHNPWYETIICVCMSDADRDAALAHHRAKEPAKSGEWHYGGGCPAFIAKDVPEWQAPS